MKNMSLRDRVDKASQILYQSLVVIIIFTVVALAAGGVIFSFTYNSSINYSENVMTTKTKHSQSKHSQSKVPLTLVEFCMGLANNTHGVIKNNSTVASYKDAVVRVTYVKENSDNSDIDPELVFKEQIINEVFPPNSRVNVDFEINAYKDLIPDSWEVINATVN